MMFGSVKPVQLTCGLKTRGSAPSSSATRYFNSLSSSMRIVCPQCAHSVLMSTERCSPRNRPCTKGVAIASSAQAPYSRSPVLKVNSCGVLSTVTGNAHDTAPCPLRTRKKRFFSSSSSIALTLARGKPRLSAMNCGCRGSPTRGSSLTAKYRTR